MKAVVFDMDGVIVDSEAWWRTLEHDFYVSVIPGFREEHHAAMVGMGVEDVYHHLVGKHRLKMSKEDFLRRSDDVARKVYKERVELADGFLELARQLKHKRVRTAIASSSPSRWIAMVIERFSLSPLLDAVVSADDVGNRTKPQPDIYLEAASRIQVPTGECLAIEDSSIGLLAAKRAGLRTAALRTVHNREQDLSLADFELAGFAGVTLEKLSARLRAA